MAQGSAPGDLFDCKRLTASGCFGIKALCTKNGTVHEESRVLAMLRPDSPTTTEKNMQSPAQPSSIARFTVVWFNNQTGLKDTHSVLSCSNCPETVSAVANASARVAPQPNAATRPVASRPFKKIQVRQLFRHSCSEAGRGALSPAFN